MKRTPKAKIPQTIQLEIGKGRQAVVFTHVMEFEYETMVRVRIKSDAVHEQCYAVVEVWAHEEWSRVAELHHTQMKTPKGLCSRLTDISAGDFAKDRTELLRVAGMILKIDLF